MNKCEFGIAKHQLLKIILGKKKRFFYIFKIGLVN